MNDGYIKIHRKLLDWEWYQDSNVFRLFIHLLLTANYKPKKWQGINVKRGETITSLSRLSGETGLTIKQVRGALNKLKLTNDIDIEGANRFTRIFIVNYNNYQLNENIQGKVGAGKGQAKGQGPDSNNFCATTSKNDAAQNKKGKQKTCERATTKEIKEYISTNLLKETNDDIVLKNEKWSSLFFLEDILISNKLIAQECQDFIVAHFSSNDGHLHEMAMAYTKIQSLLARSKNRPLLDEGKYYRAVKNALSGKSCKKWNVIDIVEDVYRFIQNKRREIQETDAAKKACIKIESEIIENKKSQEKVFQILDSLPNSQCKKIIDAAISMAEHETRLKISNRDKRNFMIRPYIKQQLKTLGHINA